MRLLDAFLTRRAAGETLDENALLATHPEHADELRKHLETIRYFEPRQQRISELLASGILQPSPDSDCSGLLDTFEIHGVLGEGGMGVVLDGRDPRLQRRVALKVLRPDLARDAIAMARFEREAAAAGALQHPNVVTVHSMGCTRGTHYMVMEYVNGPSLAEVLRLHSPLPVALVRPILQQILEGLAAAHEAGLIHRDIKSSNILLAQKEFRDRETSKLENQKAKGLRDTEPANTQETASSAHSYDQLLDPIVKIADFGLARMRSSQTQLTIKDSVIGTPEYMSPEQARGDAKIEYRTDLYSVGVVLYEMLTGRTPFRADTPTATIRRILDEEPRDPRKVSVSADPLLSRLALQLMAKRSEDRPAECAEAIQMMNAAVPIRRPPSHRDWRRGAVAILVVALAATTLYAWGFARSSAFEVQAARVDPDLKTAVQVRSNNQTEWRTFRMFTELGDRALVCAEAVHPETGNLVVVGLRRPVDNAGSVLLGLGRNAKELWRTALHNDIPWPSYKSRARWWHVSRVVTADLDTVAGDELLVVAQDADFYPTRISTIDPMTGQMQQTFWHTGHIMGLRVVPDLLGSGRPGILAWGLNNLLGQKPDSSVQEAAPRAHWEQVPVLMALDPVQLTGLSPPTQATPSRLCGPAAGAYAFLDQPGGLAVRSVGLPQSDAEGRVSVTSTCRWQINDVRPTPRRSKSDVNMLFQVSFLVTGSDGATIPVPALIVDKDLNPCHLAPAHHIAPEYADWEQWRRWWQPVTQSGDGV